MVKIHLSRFSSSIGILTNDTLCGIYVNKNDLVEDIDDVTCKRCLKSIDVGLSFIRESEGE